MLYWTLAGSRMLAGMAPVIAAAYGIGTALAVSVGAVTWVWLEGVLDRSLATRTLLTVLDAHVFIDLAMHRTSEVRALGVAMGLFTAAGVVTQTWANGALAAAALGMAPGSALRCAARQLGVLCRLWLLAAAAMALGVGTLLGSTLAAAAWIAVEGIPVPPLAVSLGGLAAAVPVAVLLVAVHDHARLRCIGAGGGALAAYRGAWRLVRRHGRQVCGLAAALALITGVVLAGTATLQWTIPSGSAGAVAVSVMLGQVLAVARSVLRAWWLAAAAALQEGLGAGRA